MKKLLLLALGVLSAITPLSAAPSIAANGVKNSASYANAAFPNGGIAEGSIFVVFGTAMGPSQITYSSTLPLPTNLAGTTVSVTVSGTTVQCPMVYTKDVQIAAILPSNTPVGTGTITVSFNGSASPTSPIKVVKTALGIFTRNQQGSGPAVVQDTNNAYNSVLFAFHPQQTVTFWGTGLGPITGSDADVPPSGNLPGVTVTATIGNQTAIVQYAGRSGYAGEDQINITIPNNVSGCYVPVAISANGVVANYTSISIAATGNVCSDPSFYSSTDLQTLANTGSLRTGNIVLTQFGLTIGNVPFLGNLLEDIETGSGLFQKWDANTFLNSTGGLSTFSVTSGSCSFYQVNGGQQFADPVQPPGLDAGPVITVTGASGSKQMKPNPVGQYSGTFSSVGLPLPGQPPATPFLVPGVYTIDNGSGGADVGSFKFMINVPAAIHWTEKDATTNIDRTKALAVHWTGGDPNSSVYVVGLSSIDQNTSGEFVCVGKDSDGGLTVPTTILSLMPVSVAQNAGGGFSIPGGELLVVTADVARETNPTGLDVFFAGMSSGDGKAVNFQ
jgi:uncharacterized protein (TIGR03437 family)